jgi:hypothetical protein
VVTSRAAGRTRGRDKLTGRQIVGRTPVYIRIVSKLGEGLRQDCHLDNIRDDPRFEDLPERMEARGSEKPAV